MKVLGIDPGTAACGYGIVHESGGRLRAEAHGWWRTSARERPEARLKTIFDGVAGLIAEHRPDAVALEDLDDVQEVYANFDIPEQVLEAVAG